MLIDIQRISAALELLCQISADTRLLQLKNLCINNAGIWAVPENPKDYSPVLYEIQLFGVPAIAGDPAELPHNWCKAARSMLEAMPAAA